MTAANRDNHLRLFIAPALRVFLNDTDRDWIDRYVPNRPSVKDLVESVGIPHPEIRVILINKLCANFTTQVDDGDVVEVYPANTHPDVDNECLLPFMPERPRFLLDVHLGGLARLLRLAGFDTLYEANDPGDEWLATQAAEQQRILLSRDVALLQRGSVRFAHWLRSTHTTTQFREVIAHYHLKDTFSPFTRCSRCNHLIEEVPKTAVIDSLPPHTAQNTARIWQCTGCGHIYWKGSHYNKIMAILDSCN